MPYAAWVFAILAEIPSEGSTLAYDDAFEPIPGGPIDWGLVDDFLDAATVAGVEWLDPWFVHPYRKKPEGALIRCSHGDGTESLWTGIHIEDHRPSTIAPTWGDAISWTLTSMTTLSKAMATIRRSARGPVSVHAADNHPEPEPKESKEVNPGGYAPDGETGPEEYASEAEGAEGYASGGTTSLNTQEAEWARTILAHLGEHEHAPFEGEVHWGHIADFFDAARECNIHWLSFWEILPYRNSRELALVRHVSLDEDQAEEVLQWDRVNVRSHVPRDDTPTWGDIVVYAIQSVTELFDSGPVLYTPVSDSESRSPETDEQPQSPSEDHVDRLLLYRRTAAALHSRIRLSRIARSLVVGSTVTFFLVVVGALAVNAATWRQLDMKPYNIVVGALLAFLSFIFAAGMRMDTGQPKDEGKKSLAVLKLDLELLEERRILEAAQGARSSKDRQHSYRESIPQEIDRLRGETRRYRRVHNFFQWGLFGASVAISVTTAIYDPPQPGKGVLIGLGAFVSFNTAVTGYFKFRERAFNLQQTADAIEQHVTAYDLAITPYNQRDETANLERLAETVESLRVEQRKREQQLEQPHQGQQDVI
ncbi:SLATT domain-containing protein [Streptomyces sp. NPDC056580]|uniref:SLATT domain-containing protein n=1 Tax=Streptomyces sp. NPDC056580 TaxID=3345872 RepID=UPI0036CFE4EE